MTENSSHGHRRDSAEGAGSAAMEDKSMFMDPKSLTAPETHAAPHEPSAVSRACRSGRHVATRQVKTDAQGVQHSRCRHCGCEISRLPVLRRWFRSGMMG
jgi:hypothetical protein